MLACVLLAQASGADLVEAVQVVDESTRLHDKLDFGEAGRALYDFFWGDFADWYIEARASGFCH